MLVARALKLARLPPRSFVRILSSSASSSSLANIEKLLQEGLRKQQEQLDTLQKQMVSPGSVSITAELASQKHEIARLAKVLDDLSMKLNPDEVKGMVPAYGTLTGELVTPMVPEENAPATYEEARTLPELVINEQQLHDLELLLNGGMTPLTGFMNQATYESVIESMKLPSGLLWPMPITLDIHEHQVPQFDGQTSVALKDIDFNTLAILDIEDVWKPDKKKEAQQVCGTSDPDHPYMKNLNKRGSFYVGGRLRGLSLPTHFDLNKYRHTPQQTRQILQKKGWSTVLGYQTRNPISKAQHAMSKRACEVYNGNLLIHPAIGTLMDGHTVNESDMSDRQTRMKCFEAVLPRYPAESAMLSSIPAGIRFAGPVEAIFHAIIRRNYGCSHFIVGKNAFSPTGLVNSEKEQYYGDYEAHERAKALETELGITIVKPEVYSYVPKDRQYYRESEIPEGVETEPYMKTIDVKNRLQNGDPIPSSYAHEEVAQVLRRAYPPRSSQGFCVFFTGLSGSGKSTIAKALKEKLREEDCRPVTVLDGEHVRRMLASELGFSEEHRNLNIERLGFVSSLIVQPGGAAIAAPIAPYRASRDKAREYVEQHGAFIEVHISTSVATCETRDKKGVYKKAKKGLLANFTGIDDPYEAPENPEIRIDTTDVGCSEAVDIIVKYLHREGFISLKP